MDRQIQVPIDEGMAFGRHVGKKYAHLTILYLSRCTAILYSYSCRALTAFGKTGLIDDQNGLLLAQVLQGIGAHLVSHQICIPDSAGEETLHSVWSPFSGLFGQLPPVFAFGFTQEPL